MRTFQLLVMMMCWSVLGMAQSARLQIIHNSPSPTVDIWVNGAPFLTNVDFRTATPFQDVPADTPLEVGIAPSPSASPADIIATFNVEFAAGETYTVIANGIVNDQATPFNLEVYAGSLEVAVNAEEVNILAFHGSPDAPAVDIAVRGVGNVVENLAFADFAGYLEVGAADIILDVKPAGSEDIVASYLAPLSTLEGAAITVFASGLLAGDPAFGLYVALADGSVIALPAYEDPAADARLQIIHNSPSPTVDIYVNDELFLPAFDFRTATPYVSVPSEVNLSIGVAPAPSNGPGDIIATFDVQLAADATYTVIANGIVGDQATPFNLEIYAGSREEATNADEVNILAFHGSTDAPAVDIAVRGLGNVIEGLAYAEFAGYLEVGAADIILDVKPAGSEDIVASYLAPLSALEGAAITVFASGLLAGDPDFGLFVALADGSVIALPAYEDPVANARLQIIHNSPSPTVDIYVNDELFLPAFDFRTATPYVTVPAEVNLSIGVAPAPSNGPADIIATFDVQLAADATYTVIANGIVGDQATPFNLEVYAGSREEATNADEVNILAFHGSPDAPAVDIAVRGLGNVIEGLAYADFAGYLEVGAADIVLDVKPAGSEDIVASYLAPLSALEGAAITVFASGLLAGDPDFGLYVALADGAVIALPLYEEPAPSARLQIIHNSPSPTVDIYVNDELFLPAFDFRTATPYVTVPAEVNLSIGVAPAPSNGPGDIIATFDVQLAADATYTVIANGIVGDQDTPFNLEVYVGSREEATNGDEVNILAFHGSPDAPAVDIAVRGLGNVIEGLAYADFAGYLEVGAADIVLDVKPAGSEDIVASYVAPLSALEGAAITVFASGLLAGDPDFGLYVALADGAVIALPLYEEPAPSARLQIIHNSPNATVDIYVNEELFLEGFAFRSATPFVTVPAGVELSIGVAAAPSTGPGDILASFDVNFEENETYIVFANGVVGDPQTPFELVILEGAQEEGEDPAQVEVVVFHGSPDAPAVDILVNGAPAIIDFAFGDAVGYLGIAPDVYTISITPAGDNGNVVAAYSADVSGLGGAAITVFASGFLGSIPGFGLWVALADGTTFPLPIVTSTENPVAGQLSVFPNPIDEQIQVRLNSPVESAIEWYIYDVQGRVLQTGKSRAISGENQFEIPAIGLTSGWYVLEMRAEQGEPLRLPLIKK